MIIAKVSINATGILVPRDIARTNLCDIAECSHLSPW